MEKTTEGLWSLRDKLCLASCVMRYTEDWPSVSKHMKLTSDSNRSPEYFSQKNCAQQYTTLVEALSNSHNLRRRSAEASLQQQPIVSSNETDSIATQLVAKLTAERLEELRIIIHRQKSAYRKIRKEIEAIKNGEMDDKLEAMLSEDEKKDTSGASLTESFLIMSPRKSSSKSVNSVTTPGKNETFSAADDDYNKQDEPKLLSDPEKSIIVPPTTPLFIGHADSPGVQMSPSISPPRLIYSQISPTKSIIRSPPMLRKSPMGPGPSLSPRIEPIFDENAKEKSENAQKIEMVSPEKEIKLETATKMDETKLVANEPIEPKLEPQSKIVSPVASLSLGSPDLDSLKLRPTPRRELRSSISISEKSDSSLKDLQQSSTIANSSITPSSEPAPAKDDAASSTLRFSMRRRSEVGAATGAASPVVAAATNATTPVEVATRSVLADLDGYRAWKRAIMGVVGVVAGHKHANLFCRPVTDDQAPCYSKLVKKPMCLNDLKKSIESQQVLSILDFKRDLLLVFANAVMYNPRQHDVHLMAAEMADDVLPRVDELLASLAQTAQAAAYGHHLHSPPIASGSSGAATPTPSPFNAPVEEVGRSLRGSRGSMGAAGAAVKTTPSESGEKSINLRKRDLSETSSLDGSSNGPPAKRHRV